MAKQQILEGNKLIAEFLGYKYFGHNDLKKRAGTMPGWSRNGVVNPKRNGNIGDGWLCRSHNELRFYNSWDWLMPVYKKALTLNTHSANPYIIFIANTALMPADIQKMFTGLVEFINWYNNKKL